MTDGAKWVSQKKKKRGLELYHTQLTCASPENALMEVDCVIKIGGSCLTKKDCFETLNQVRRPCGHAFFF
jgi:hypothetical protein